MATAAMRDRLARRVAGDLRPGLAAGLGAP